MKKRLLCLFLTLALLVSVLLPTVPGVQAAKQEKSRAIAIVFDNSGSMYINNNTKGWCRATYATEVFASMMNSGDKLLLYPMNPITLGVGAFEDASIAPLTINGPEQSETIRQIYTPWAGDTPFRTVTEAYQGLMSAKADEKYLIILTDGKFEETQHENGNSWNKVEDMDTVNKTLDQYSQDVQVMYLGLGVAKEYRPTEGNPSRQTYVNTTDSSAVLAELTSMCNQIFGRDLLPMSGNTVDFSDLPMSKLIVFVQGENISDVTLGGKKPVSQHSTKYSTLGCGNPDYTNWAPDTSLQGVIATFENLDAGSYELSYTGSASSTSVYFEPDVDLQVQLLDENGTPVTGDEIYAGTYKLQYGLVDKQGNPVNSPLLKNLNYNLHYEANGQTYDLNETTSGSVDLELAPDSKLDGVFSVRYLSDYSIEKDAAKLGWNPDGFKVIPRPAGQVVAKITGGADLYPLSRLEELARYQVSLTCDGEAITGEELDRVTLDVKLDGGNAVPQVKQTGDGFEVTLCYCGSAAETKCGEQSLSFDIAYTNKDGQTGKADPITKEFEIEDNTTALEVDIQITQKRYVISKLDEAEPIRIQLTASGAPLTPEQFAATQVAVDMDSLLFDLQPDPQNASYLAKLQPGQTIEPGLYKVTCTATGVDEIGRPVTAEDTARLNCQKYPGWIVLLFWILVAIVLLTIIMLILNAKILPKKITINANAIFNVDGEIIPGNVMCNYSGGNKKRGSLKVQSPPYMANPLAKCGFTLDLEAVSPRRTKSRSRFARVRAVKPLNPATTVSIMVGGFQMARDPVSDKLVRVGANPDAPVDFRIGNNNQFIIAADIQSMDDGSSITCSLTGNLTFL